MKKCKLCLKDKNDSEYYFQNKKTGTLLGKCKDCIKLKVRSNRLNNIDYYRKYDRDRGNRQTAYYLSEHRKKYPMQTKAQRKVAYEISKGNIKEEPCEICHSKNSIHAHHDDYSNPLKIRWLCAGCHKQWHRDNGEGLNR